MEPIEQRQREMCKRYAAECVVPRDDQMCAVSAGVLEGDPVQGVRYRAPSHMSGWYLTTSRYDGDHRSLRVEHVAHVVDRRPDVAAFLGLPPGYRFDVGGGTAEAWFDAAVAGQEA